MSINRAFNNNMKENVLIIFPTCKYCAIKFVDVVVSSIAVEIIFSRKLDNNLSYWLQQWQQQCSQEEKAAENPAKYQHLGINSLRLQNDWKMFRFHYSVLMFAESSKSGWFSLILSSSVSSLLDSTAFRVYFCKLN